MDIIYISPNNYVNPHLFPTYKKTFEELGHAETNKFTEATHCFIEIVSGGSSYDPNLMWLIKERELPIICFDNREFGVMNTGTWRPLNLNPDIYFVRTMVKGFEYPDNVYPYDWAYFNDCDFEPVSKDELFNRPYDVCFIGVESPTRTNVINALIKDGGLKVKHIFNDHLTRLPHKQWINEYREAKLAIEIEGGGLTSEKFLQLFSVCPSLRVINEMQMAFPFTDGIDCLEISKEPTEEEIEKVIDILDDKNWLYDIYMGGIQTIKKYYSEEAVSQYVLDILKQNGICQ